MGQGAPTSKREGQVEGGNQKEVGARSPAAQPKGLDLGG